jgi:hypothetical protein
MGNSNQVGYGLIGGSDRLLPFGPGIDGLPNHLRSGEAFPASYAREALAGF